MTFPILKACLIGTFLWTAPAWSSSPQTNGSLKEAWDRPNAPIHLAPGYVGAFDELPLTAQIDFVPWTDTYWPNAFRGISWRWQISDQIRLMPTRNQLLQMSTEDVAKLSPAEKYDILIGNYNYSLTRYEQQRTSESHDSWWGLCHGWAAASINFEEPSPVVLSNQDGIQIEFGAADIKALLTFVQQYNRRRSEIDFLGLRCNQNLDQVDSPRALEPDCKGVNAGSFHLTLANRIGLSGQSLVGDFERGYQVWTFPVTGYESAVVDETSEVYPEAADGTTSIVRVVTRMHYIGLSMPSWESIGDRDVGQFASRDYVYKLELDANRQIIGGEWETDNRPDFLWMQTPPEFQGYFSALGRLATSRRQ